MDKNKQQRLESAGWKVGNAEDFLKDCQHNMTDANNKEKLMRGYGWSVGEGNAWLESEFGGDEFQVELLNNIQGWAIPIEYSPTGRHGKKVVKLHQPGANLNNDYYKELPYIRIEIFGVEAPKVDFIFLNDDTLISEPYNKLHVISLMMQLGYFIASRWDKFWANPEEFINDIPVAESFN